MHKMHRWMRRLKYKHYGESIEFIIKDQDIYTIYIMVKRKLLEIFMIFFQDKNMQMPLQLRNGKNQDIKNYVAQIALLQKILIMEAFVSVEYQKRIYNKANQQCANIVVVEVVQVVIDTIIYCKLQYQILINFIVFQVMIDIPTMYVKSHKDQTFGFKQYKINPEYLDPKKKMMQRQFERRKKTKSTKKVVYPKRKPCFMDDYLRHIKFVPGPGRYQMKRDLTIASSSVAKPSVDKKIKKNTYIQQIQRQKQLSLATPSVGVYQVTKSLDQYKNESIRLSHKKIKYDQKRHALDNFQFLSSEVPGAGNYNHSEAKKIKKQTRKQSHFIKKHIEQEKLRRTKSARPDFIAYQPIPQHIRTFTQTSREFQKNKYISKWQHGVIVKKQSSTGFLISPGPATYSLINKWEKTKDAPETNKYVNLLKRTSSGYKPGIYH